MSPKPKNTPHRVLLSLPTDLYNTISRVSAAMEKPRAVCFSALDSSIDLRYIYDISFGYIQSSPRTRVREKEEKFQLG